MKKLKIQILIAGVLFFIISSCDRNRLFEDFYQLPEAGWSKDSLVVFEFPVTDTLQYHNLYVDVRNKITYGYSNLWLFIKIEEPGGIVKKDTFEITLADPMGKWLGKGFGGLKTSQVIYRRNVFFPRSGIYKISIGQGMREEKLQGISDIGLRVEKL